MILTEEPISEAEVLLERRDRSRPLKVLVSDTERAAIGARAKAANLSISSYLRNLGLAWQPKSQLDQQAIRDLVKIIADQGRLGGLLKLWLSEKPGEGASTFEVRRVLRRIEDLQLKLRDHVRHLKGAP